MGKINDLIGLKFGKLKVIERMPNNKWKKSMWKCICDCGNEVIVLGNSLLSNRTQSCGCLHKEIVRKTNKELYKKYNTYNLFGEYGIGYTLKGEEFYFDLEDYDKIKNYCWSKHKGYIVSKENDSHVLLHRIILDINDDYDTDHINHNTADNRKINIRICKHQENMCNRKLNINNTSGYKGIVWDKNNNCWRSQIGYKSKVINLGYYDNIIDAVKARNQAEEEYFKEYKNKDTPNYNNQSDFI